MRLCAKPDCDCCASHETLRTDTSFHNGRRECGNPLVSFEIAHVECEEMWDAVHVHRSNKLGIVNRDTLDRVSYDKPSPFLKGCKTIREQAKVAFNQADSSFCLD